eukprot:g13249.t1
MHVHRVLRNRLNDNYGFQVETTMKGKERLITGTGVEEKHFVPFVADVRHRFLIEYFGRISALELVIGPKGSARDAAQLRHFGPPCQHNSQCSAAISTSEKKQERNEAARPREQEKQEAQPLVSFVGSALCQHAPGSNVRCGAVSADRIATGTDAGDVCYWDRADSGNRRVLSGHTDLVNSVALSPDGQRLVSGGRDETVRIWSCGTGQALHVLRGHAGPVVSVAFSADGQKVASGSDDNTAKVWDSAKGHTDWVTDIAHSAAFGNAFCTKSYFKDAKCVAELAVARALAKPVICVREDEQNAHALPFQDLQTVDQAIVSHERVRQQVGSAFGAGVEQERPSACSAAGSQQDSKKHIDQSDAVLQGHTNWVYAVACSPDGALVASGSWDNSIMVWDARSHRSLQVLQGHTDGELRMHRDRVKSVAFSPDGTLLASGSTDNSICLWRGETGEWVRSLQGHSDGVTSVAFSADGRQLASGSKDNSVRLWDVQTGQAIRTLQGHSDIVWSVAFSKLGQLASGSWDNTIRLWNAEIGEEQAVLRGHTFAVMSVAWSPDGKRLASASTDNTLNIWEADGGSAQKPMVLKEHSRGVDSVAFLDQKRLVSSSADETVWLWSIKNQAWLDAATMLKEPFIKETIEQFKAKASARPVVKHAFISHVQKEAGDAAYLLSTHFKFDCHMPVWYDKEAHDPGHSRLGRVSADRHQRLLQQRVVHGGAAGGAGFAEARAVGTRGGSALFAHGPGQDGGGEKKAKRGSRSQD